MTNDTAPSRFKAVWPATLILTCTLGSLAAACMVPFVGVAVVAAATLTRPQAIITVAVLWLTNQLVGFGLLGYPATSYAVGWGLAIGGAVMAAFFGARQVTAGGADPVATPVAFGLGFVLFEGLLLLFALAVGGVDTFTPEIVVAILLNDAIWCVGLFLLHAFLARAVPQMIGGRLPARSK